MIMTGWKLYFDARISKHEVQCIFAFMCDYIMTIIKYIVVWTFLVLLFEYFDPLSVDFGGNLAGNSPECQNVFFSIFQLIH